MKILLSPAKSLNFEKPSPFDFSTNLDFLKQANTINKVLKKQKVKDLMQLMDISENLAQLNFERNQIRDFSNFETNAKAAIFAFDGDVYTGFDAYTLKREQVDFINESVRILSGLYGLIKPFDLIQPYRLEMGTSIKIGTKNNLYEFWKETLSKSLKKELAKEEFIVNLASKEYASAIDLKSFGKQVITPEFKEFKNGKYSVVSFFAKKARGLMTRYIVDNQFSNPEDMKSFDLENYRFDENLSKANHWVFTR